MTFLEKVACAIGWHDMPKWTTIGEVKELLGSGVTGQFDPEKERGKWVYTGEVMQQRSCLRCHIEKRRRVVVAVP